MKSRLYKALLSLIILMFLIGGCNYSINKKFTYNNKEKKTELILLEDKEGFYDNALDSLINQFESKNKDIKIIRKHCEDVNYEIKNGKDSWDTAITLNTHIAELNKGKKIKDLKGKIPEELILRLDPKSVDAGKYNSKQYLIPDNIINSVTLLYNKNIISNPPQSFKELEQIGGDLKTKGKIEYIMAFDTNNPLEYVPFLGAFQGKIFEDPMSSNTKIMLNTEEVQNWIEFIKTLVDKKYIPWNISEEEVDKLFLENKIPFIITSTDKIKEYKKQGMNFEVYTIPSIEDKYPSPFIITEGYVINEKLKDKKKIKALDKYLNFILSKESQTKIMKVQNRFPTNMQLIKSDIILKDPIKLLQKEQLDKSVPKPIIPETEYVLSSMAETINEFIYGKINSKEAIEIMQRKAEDEIKNMKR